MWQKQIRISSDQCYCIIVIIVTIVIITVLIVSIIPITVIIANITVIPANIITASIIIITDTIAFITITSNIIINTVIIIIITIPGIPVIITVIIAKMASQSSSPTSLPSLSSTTASKNQNHQIMHSICISHDNTYRYAGNYKFHSTTPTNQTTHSDVKRNNKTCVIFTYIVCISVLQTRGEIWVHNINTTYALVVPYKIDRIPTNSIKSHRNIKSFVDV